MKRTLTVGYNYYPQSEKPHPYIRLQGSWLREAGFDIKDRVEVSVSEGQIVISRDGDAVKRGGESDAAAGPPGGSGGQAA